jgi:hypothetical protein
VLIDGYWDSLWILLISHGSLAFVGLNRSNLHSLSCPPTLPLLLLHLHLGQLCWCRGGDILGIYGITNLWVMGRRFLTWGRHGILVLHRLLHNITGFAFNLRCWGCFIILAQGIGNPRVMGARYWSCGYRRQGARNTTTIVGSCLLFCL